MVRRAKKLVIHIEDDADQRLMLEKKLLPKCDYLGFESAEEAEKHLSDKNLCVIILDLALPLMNGFEFLKKNKRQISERKISVIVTTGLEGAGIEPLANEYHCAALYKKPIEQHDIVDKIKEIMGA